MVGSANSDSPWLTSLATGIRYGINGQGQLDIEDPNGNQLFISDYVGGPGVPFALQTAGIFIGVAAITAYRLLDPNKPNVGPINGWFKLGNALMFAVSGGKHFFNTASDPLVLDLTGNGIRLTAESVAAPSFDMNNTGFAIPTGWVQPGTGLLVLDKNGNGTIDDGSELLGAPAPIGFAALAQYDSNGDGVIDASDPIYSQLQVWVDQNGNAQVDPGELETLAQAGITSITVASTAAPDGTTIAGNIVNATGSFTRTDGTTGAIDDVSFTVDPMHSTYVGDKTVSAAAAAMPNLKGYGTLTDLQVAMTLDPTLIDTINAGLANFNQVDLDALRDAAVPILDAWAKAVQLPDANGVLQTVDPVASHTSMQILVHSDSLGNPVVDDFAYQATDSSGNTYWKLASGHDVKDAQGNVIAATRPSTTITRPIISSWAVRSATTSSMPTSRSRSTRTSCASAESK